MLESPIEPTVGRIVLLRGPALSLGNPAREVPGIVTRVWSQNCINVQAFADSSALPHLTSVMYDDDLASVVSHVAWRWMAYQVAQAAAQESAAPAEAK